MKHFDFIVGLLLGLMIGIAVGTYLVSVKVPFYQPVKIESGDGK